MHVQVCPHSFIRPSLNASAPVCLHALISCSLHAFALYPCPFIGIDMFLLLASWCMQSIYMHLHLLRLNAFALTQTQCICTHRHLMHSVQNGFSWEYIVGKPKWYMKYCIKQGLNSQPHYKYSVVKHHITTTPQRHCKRLNTIEYSPPLFLGT